MALVSMPAKDELPAAEAVVWEDVEGGGAGGANADWSTAMRATTVSMLTRFIRRVRRPT
jgi:hypothetical protein